MRNKIILPFLVAAGLVLFGGLGISQAGELKVNGFADVILTLMDEFSDDDTVDSDGNLANATEKKFTTDGEIDFEYIAGRVRLYPGPLRPLPELLALFGGRPKSNAVPVPLPSPSVPYPPNTTSIATRPLADNPTVGLSKTSQARRHDR